jgi:hypothetical protein
MKPPSPDTDRPNAPALEAVSVAGLLHYRPLRLSASKPVCLGAWLRKNAVLPAGTFSCHTGYRWRQPLGLSCPPEVPLPEGGPSELPCNSQHSLPSRPGRAARRLELLTKTNVTAITKSRKNRLNAIQIGKERSR